MKSFLISPSGIGAVGLAAAVAAGGWFYFNSLPPESAASPALVETVERKSSHFESNTDANLPGPSRDEWLEMLRAKWASGASANEIITLLQSFAETDPRLALDLAETIGRTEEEKGKFLTAVMTSWVARDVTGAWAWTLTQSSRLSLLPGQAPILGVVMEQMAQSDVAGLLAQANTFLEGTKPAGWDNDYMTEMVTEALSKTGHLDLARATIESWVQGAHGAEVSSEAMEGVARRLAETASPAEAAAWLNSLPACDGKNGALLTRAVAWAGQDPTTAMRWAQDLGEMRDEAMRGVFARWIHFDVSAAIEWLRPEAAKPQSDSTTARMMALVVSDCLPEDQAATLEWAQAIANPALREHALEQGILRWGDRDRAAATAYVLQSSAWLPEKKQELLQNMQGRAQAGN